MKATVVGSYPVAALGDGAGKLAPKCASIPLDPLDTPG
jgi:hypothetical protein